MNTRVYRRKQRMEIPTWLFVLIIILLIFFLLDALRIIDIIPNVGAGWPS